MSFAAGLTKIVAGKKSEIADREKIALSWKDKEAKLLEEAVNLFKSRCVKEAELQKTDATISFEVITREIPDFPKRILTDSTYFVDSWPNGTTAESWFYATRGVNSSWSPGAPILFAEVLQAMLPKFVERVKDLGFPECNHEAGTWKVAVSWPTPDENSVCASCALCAGRLPRQTKVARPAGSFDHCFVSAGLCLRVGFQQCHPNR